VNRLFRTSGRRLVAVLLALVLLAGPVSLGRGQLHPGHHHHPTAQQQQLLMLYALMLAQQRAAAAAPRRRRPPARFRPSGSPRSRRPGLGACRTSRDSRATHRPSAGN
jgi:hypothetical protein